MQDSISFVSFLQSVEPPIDPQPPAIKKRKRNKQTKNPEKKTIVHAPVVKAKDSENSVSKHSLNGSSNDNGVKVSFTI